jgi:hypothetical protein
MSRGMRSAGRVARLDRQWWRSRPLVLMVVVAAASAVCASGRTLKRQVRGDQGFALALGRRVSVATFTVVLFFGAGVLVAPSARASTFTTFAAPISGATDYATGFPNSGFGPAGVLFDGTNFFVFDPANGRLYRFPASGGTAATATSATAPFNYGIGLAGGVAYGTSGSGARTFNPTTLAVGPTLNFSVGCQTASVIADPLSTSLFMSSFCGIYRIDNPLSATPTVTRISPTPDFYDGLTITSDGQHLWGAEYFLGNVVELSRTGSVQNTIFIGIDNPDGLVVARPNTTVSGINVSNNLFVNDNDGTVKRIDTNNANAVSNVASGGTRGDEATVGPDGCVYITQTDRVEKLAPCFSQTNVTPPDIFEVTLTRCTTLNVGYNRFPNGTAINWRVNQTGTGTLASGSFTAIGGGNLGSKTYHFLTIPLGVTLKPDSASIHTHVRFSWTIGSTTTLYEATRDPGC